MAVILKIQSAPEEFIEHADSWVQPPREQDSLSELISRNEYFYKHQEILTQVI